LKQDDPETRFAELRSRMVAGQLATRSILDPRVLAAFGKVERHRFVPEESRLQAYDDHPLPIGLGQTISQPYMVALMTERLEISGGEKTLEIGTGSGYQAAILAELGARVYTVERIADLAERARGVLDELGYREIHLRVGDGTRGWPEEAPFDRIIVTAGGPEVPPPLTKQLAEGGILVAPVGSRSSQTLTIVRKCKGRIKTTTDCGCIFVKLIGRHGWPSEE